VAGQEAKMKSGVVSRIKSTLVPDVSQVRIVPLGLYKGLHLNINLRSETQLFLGLWERETYGAIRQAAPRAKWFIDVGAGKGELCIFFARLEHVKRIIAIEPNHAEAQTLIANLSYNNIDPNSIEVFEKFAGTEKDDRYVKIDHLNIISSIHGFIKIDVDGFELDVLRSGQQLLLQGNADLLIETHSAELEQSCIEKKPLRVPHVAALLTTAPLPARTKSYWPWSMTASAARA
jgi:Methyltransferase FkbM domain